MGERAPDFDDRSGRAGVFRVGQAESGERVRENEARKRTNRGGGVEIVDFENVVDFWRNDGIFVREFGRVALESVQANAAALRAERQNRRADLGGRRSLRAENARPNRRDRTLSLERRFAGNGARRRRVYRRASRLDERSNRRNFVEGIRLYGAAIGVYRVKIGEIRRP